MNVNFNDINFGMNLTLTFVWVSLLFWILNLTLCNGKEETLQKK